MSRFSMPYCRWARPICRMLERQLIFCAVILALLKAADTGQNFWIILASAIAVFLVVQAIIDFIVTPKIMGKAMGLNPAILLLSLSVWGALLGFIGLIIALL